MHMAREQQRVCALRYTACLDRDKACHLQRMSHHSVCSGEHAVMRDSSGTMVLVSECDRQLTGPDTWTG